MTSDATCSISNATAQDKLEFSFDASNILNIDKFVLAATAANQLPALTHVVAGLDTDTSGKLTVAYSSPTVTVTLDGDVAGAFFPVGQAGTRTYTLTLKGAVLGPCGTNNETPLKAFQVVSYKQ